MLRNLWVAICCCWDDCEDDEDLDRESPNVLYTAVVVAVPCVAVWALVLWLVCLPIGGW